MSNKVKVFIAFNHESISGKLTKFFTGCYAYHVGFFVEETDTLYDSNLMFRKTPRPDKYKDSHFVVFDSPVEVDERYLEEQVMDGVKDLCEHDYLTSLYGFRDYMMFGLRSVYHLFGKSTPNFKGTVCSEKVNDILIHFGWDSPFTKEVPSPCDFVKYFKYVE